MGFSSCTIESMYLGLVYFHIQNTNNFRKWTLSRCPKFNSFFPLWPGSQKLILHALVADKLTLGSIEVQLVSCSVENGDPPPGSLDSSSTSYYKHFGRFSLKSGTQSLKVTHNSTKASIFNTQCHTVHCSKSHKHTERQRPEKTWQQKDGVYQIITITTN